MALAAWLIPKLAVLNILIRVVNTLAKLAPKSTLKVKASKTLPVLFKYSTALFLFSIIWGNWTLQNSSLSCSLNSSILSLSSSNAASSFSTPYSLIRFKAKGTTN